MQKYLTVQSMTQQFSLLWWLAGLGLYLWLIMVISVDIRANNWPASGWAQLELREAELGGEQQQLRVREITTN